MKTIILAGVSISTLILGTVAFAGAPGTVASYISQASNNDSATVDQTQVQTSNSNSAASGITQSGAGNDTAIVTQQIDSASQTGQTVFSSIFQQGGAYNFASVKQVQGGGVSGITQDGSNNHIEVNQTYAANSGIYQTGSYQQAYVTQGGGDPTSSIAQSNYNNLAVVSQSHSAAGDYDYGTSSGVAQSGQNGFIQVTQTDALGTASTVTQDSGSNTSTAIVTQTAGASTSGLYQNGYLDHAEVSQTNSAELGAGAQEVSYIDQTGDSQQAYVAQSGLNQASGITQSGYKNYASVTQGANGVSSSILQSGSGAQAYVTQNTNPGAVSSINQSGPSGGLAIVKQ